MDENSISKPVRSRSALIAASLIALCLFLGAYLYSSLPSSIFQITEKNAPLELSEASQGQVPTSREFFFNLENAPQEAVFLLAISDQPIDRLDFNLSQLGEAEGAQTTTLLPSGAIYAAFFNVPRNYLFPGKNRISVAPSQGMAQPANLSVTIVNAKMANAVIERITMWDKIWPAMALSLGILTVSFCLGGLSLGQRISEYLPVMLMAAIIAAIATLAFNWQGTEWAAHSGRVSAAVLACLAGLLGIGIVGAARRDERFDSVEMAMVGLFIITLGMSAIGLAAKVYVFSAPLAFCMIAIFPIAFVSYRSARLFWTDLRAFRSTLRALKSTIDEQADELDAKSQLVANEMQRIAVLEERQRMMRDIHDGIGGQLLSLMLRVKSGSLSEGETASGIKQSLTDLRLVVDSTDHLGGDLMSALATFRSRAQQQLNAAGIKLNWQFNGDMDGQFKATGKTLDIYRFMQEAVTNIVRHSGANAATVNIAYQSAQERLVVEILDDGCGLPDDYAAHAGKGLANLTERARKLEAEHSLERAPDGTGTLVRLSLDPGKITC